ncbi:hypothetical protein K3N28_06185 [Glycomyces sp. TRM65418]|uniref:LamG-like jellyroll fold domain-containing protein n=1 Tax=Glycomyces sp. TRM65418 TaxID=2867006 RepID=UPI001CE602BE|nr:LamG-like jellyroll fold domain-containing protein [Glycomyces sp. TRM65418]MCC3762658.1 hypothetical protein [Glycomyces sp. TRM65418]QZD56693.1 hypothetical protein K3N28_06140 [Glycomyces sp. TRM65418]
MRDLVGARSLTTLALGALVGAGLAVPAAAQDPASMECTIDTGEVAELEGELDALGQAAACGRPVEVVDQRNEFGTVVAMPSGELKAEIGVEPIQAQDESGQWAPIDTTLEVAADGSVRPVNITEDVSFSAGGIAPLAAVDYGAEGGFTLSWPGELPEPALDGPQAIYDEVLAGVDLVVEATAQGFRYDLVVADAEAAQHPDLEAIAFAVEASGVAVVESATGSVEVEVAGQAEMASGEALMWEAPSSHDGSETVPDLTAITDTPKDSDQEIAPVEVTLESDDVVLRPDLELLRGEDTRYPVVIDPQWNGGIQDNLWGLVNTKFPNSAFYRGKNSSGSYFMNNTGTLGNAGAGQTCDSWNNLDCYSSTYDMRSMFRMDTDTITQNDYKIPNKGLFKIIQNHSASCSNGTARIYRTGGYNANDTWNTQPAWHESVSISSANNGATCDGSAYVSFNVTSMVKTADDNGWANLTLGLRAPDESPSPELLQWNRFDSFSAVLEIYYDVMPYAVSNRKLNGVFCTTSVENAPWTNSRTPRMSALYRSQDTSLLYQARLRSSTPVDAIVYDYTTSEPLTSNKEYSNTLPSRYALGDGLYYWLARSFSSTNTGLASAWSPPCRFKVDGTKPSTPTVTPGSEGPYQADGTLSLTLASEDPVVNGIASGIDHFEYSWQSNSFDKHVDSTGTATISRTLSAGRHVLYVRAVDKAGNESDQRAYTFFVGRDILATPMATWRFEGDTLDDTGHGHNLELADGASIAYTADRDGRTDAALALDGSTCLSVQDPIMRTDAAYSLSAWVRMDAVDEATERPIAQLNDSHSAFQVWYSATADLWYFSVLDQNKNWNSIGAAPTVALGAWEHIGAVYDPDKSVIRLYLGGFLVGEKSINFTPWNADKVFSLGCLMTAGTPVHHVSGAIDQVGLWQGVLSQADIQAAMTDLPTASVQAQWTFRNDGTDDSGHGRDLNTDGLPVGTDPYHRPSGAIELDGTTCLEYPEPVVDTTQSFTVAAWAKLDSTSANATVVATSGQNTSAVRLRYVESIGKWAFVFTDQDSATAAWPQVQSTEIVEADRWYHLVGVFDAPTKELKLYVDGVLQGTRTNVTSVWNATGPTILGCAGHESGPARWDRLDGSLHGVSLWRGAVDTSAIAGMMGNPPVETAARWDFNNFPEDLTVTPTPGADLTGNGNDLTVTGSESYDFGYNNALDNALLVDGTNHVRTIGPVIATDESFTIATWMRADDLTRDGVAVSIPGADRSTIVVKYSTAKAHWEFAAPPAAGGTWHTAGAAATPSDTHVGYIFLVGVYDLPSNELRLYIDGALIATATDVVMPSSTGSVVIGAEGNADGTIRDGLIGAVDDTIIWQGALDCATIASIYDPELPAQVCGS